MPYKSFEELDVWKECREFRKSISLLCKFLPTEEKYKLVDQIIRSSRSVTANIAEGHGRYHFQENIQSCRQARGSLIETMDHLIVANDEGYIDEKKLAELRLIYSICLRLLNGYILYLKNRKSQGK
ncbi:MAG: four helix bundle protein [Bacteroidota bacterium]